MSPSDAVSKEVEEFMRVALEESFNDIKVSENNDN